MHYHEAFTPEDRDTLWNKGVLATDSPTELQNAIFYYTTCAFVVERSIETSSAHSLLKLKAATAMLSEVVSASYISPAKVLFYTTMLMQECGDTDTAHSLSSPVQTPADNSDAVYLQPASERCTKRQFYSVGMAQQLMKLVSGQTC